MGVWVPIDVWFAAVGATVLTDKQRQDPTFRAYAQLMRRQRVGAGRGDVGARYEELVERLDRRARSV